MPRLAYRDRKNRVWFVSEVAQLKVVSASIDGPNHFLVIRFEREGEERFARWIGGTEWQQSEALHRLFDEAEGVGVEQVEKPAARVSASPDDTGVGPAPPETIALWVAAITTMGPEELADFEERTFRQWDPKSLGDVRRAIRWRRDELSR